MVDQCATEAATVTDDHDLQLHTPNSPTPLQEIFSDDAAYTTLEPIATSLQHARLLSDVIVNNSAQRYQCTTAAVTVTQLPPFPSEYWDTIGGFDIGTETAKDGMHFSPPPADFFEFENPFLTMQPEIPRDDPQYTGLLSDVVDFDSAGTKHGAPLNFPDGPEAGRCYYAQSEPPPNLAEGKKKKRRFWTKEEHMLFLSGIEKYGKGNWKAISTKLVVTKTSTQVASHAQKYYDYHQNPNSRQRNGKSGMSKSSIFEITDVDSHTKACLLRRDALIVQPPSPPLPLPLQPFTLINYNPPPHQPN